MKNIKQRLKNGETLNGCWITLGSAFVTEMVGHAGFDWVMIDLEHGAGSEKDVSAQIMALTSSNTAALVRVESPEPLRISRILEMGAEGIMVPKVNNEDIAQKVISGMHYPPIGNRGVATMIRPAAFGKTFQEYYEKAPNTLLGILQIETAEALNHLDEIAGIEGVDVLFIGPADLSMDLGIFGQFENPIYIDAVKKTVAAAEKAGKAVGILFSDPADYKKYYNLGIRFLACGTDQAFVLDGAKTMADKLGFDRKTLLQ